MASRRKDDDALPTIWRVPDEVWDRAALLIDKYDPPGKTGRPRSDERDALDGVIYRMRTGCQWNALPREFGDDSSVHRAMQRWVRCGLFEHLWALLLLECEELGGVDWRWQSADGVMGKARHGGIASDRTPPTAEKTARNAAC
jgi:putative transposase